MAITIENKETAKYGTTVTMELIQCYKCAIPFAVPTDFKAFLRSSQEQFFRPNGHPQCYSKSTETLLREKLESQQRAAQEQEARLKAAAFDARQEADGWRTQWEKQLQEKKKVAAKLKQTEKRIANGVCPCCNRTFADLARHMQSKHPGQVKSAK